MDLGSWPKTLPPLKGRQTEKGQKEEDNRKIRKIRLRPVGLLGSWEQEPGICRRWSELEQTARIGR